MADAEGDAARAAPADDAGGTKTDSRAISRQTIAGFYDAEGNPAALASGAPSAALSGVGSILAIGRTRSERAGA
jgi:hypothetical protein